MVRSSTLCALALSIPCLTALPQAARATCKALTPAILRHDLIGANTAFAFDDEGQVSSPLYLTIAAVAADGTLQGTLSSTVLPTPTLLARPTFAVTGIVTQSGPGVLSVSFSVQPTRGVFTTYSGAIQVFPSCYLAIAGLYSTEQMAGGVGHAKAGPMPFSGKVVRVPAVPAAE